MKTLFEVEARTDVIRLRVSDIFREFRTISTNSPQAQDLVDELETLLAEFDMIKANLAYVLALTERLARESCSGPH